MLLSIFTLGVLAITAQTAFLREILATFRSGELIIGAALLFWLLWTAAGSGWVSRIAMRYGSSGRLFHRLLPWYGVFGYFGVALIADIPFIIRLTPGELVPFDIQFIAVALAFLPFNILGGILFSLGVKALENKKLPFAGTAFTLEALGSALAGVFISIVLVTFISNHQLALLCPLTAYTVTLYWSLRHSQKGIIKGLAIPVIILGFILWGNKQAFNYLYRGQELLRQIDTKYSRLSITRRGEMIAFYSDADVLFNAPDPETSEYVVHIPMLAAPLRRSVLVLGGGPGGILDEVLKYKSVETVTCVELDPNLFSLAEKYLDEDWNRDPRVRTVFADGRAFIEKTDATFDVIIMTMPPPLSGVTNRYYTSEFFQLAASHLTEEGIFGFSLPGAENFIPDDLARFLASIRETLRTAFPSVTVLPGITCHYLACTKTGVIDSLRWEDLTDRQTESGIETAYVRDYYLRYTMSPERMDFIRSRLDVAGDTFVNTDTQPIGFFARTLLQGKLDRSHILSRIEPLGNSRVLLILMGIMLVSIAGYALLPGKSSARRSIVATIISVGLTEISLEVLAIMAYQSLFGFLYGRIALLTGSFMAGLAIGGWAGTRRVERHGVTPAHLLFVQAGITVIPLLWLILIRYHAAFPGATVLTEAGFYVLTVLAGMAGGLQFPAADALYRQTAGSGSSGEGFMYGVDLAGSSVGALLTASLMIPVMGMTAVLLFLAVLNGVTACVLWLRLRV